MNEIIDEREECITHCFKARKGSTDSVYCIEKCNESFNARLDKTLINTSLELKKQLSSDWLINMLIIIIFYQDILAAALCQTAYSRRDALLTEGLILDNAF